MTYGTRERQRKPDFRNGFPTGDVPDGGMALGQADGEDVILVRWQAGSRHRGNPGVSGLRGAKIFNARRCFRDDCSFLV